MKKLKPPKNDRECRKILKEVCRRTDEQIDAIFAYAKLAKNLGQHQKNKFKKGEKKNEL